VPDAASSNRRYLVTGPRLGLRKVTADDDQWLYELVRDPDVQRNLNYRVQDESFEQWRRRPDALVRSKSWLRCVAASLVDSEAVGFVSLGSVKSAPELIVLLRPAWRGKGYGTEAARLLVDYGFGRMGIEKIGGGALSGNKASIRMLEKLGFVRQPEGDYVAEDQWGDGTVVEWDFALHRARWEGMRR